MTDSNKREQSELPLPFPDLSDDMPLLPARMVNEYQYCPRLAYLEWVQGEWRASADTVEGRHAHRRVDRPQRQAAGGRRRSIPMRTSMPARSRCRPTASV